MKSVKKRAAERDKSIVVESRDVVPIRDYMQIGRRKIPVVRFYLPEGVVVTAYGSHLKKTPSRTPSVLIHKEGDYAVDVRILPEPVPDQAVTALQQLAQSDKWSVMIDARNAQQGLVTQGAMQGRIDEPLAIALLTAARGILANSANHKQVQLQFNPALIVSGVRVDLLWANTILELVVECVKAGNASQLDLLKKAITAVCAEQGRAGTPSQPKAVSIALSVLAAARKHDRVPFAGEIHDIYYNELNKTADSAVFYRELKSSGFGWIAIDRAPRGKKDCS